MATVTADMASPDNGVPHDKWNDPSQFVKSVTGKIVRATLRAGKLSRTPFTLLPGFTLAAPFPHELLRY